ncbi:hypothetical protein D1222_14460 [Henriciella algicola]|uniref:Uncharacterized protein n=1 Tax=Henriciella algicola TaxID=1608422 RepID=A0A399RCR9_9PROT|nr:hypothetical protein D1222_14460 [Henriciella algicola]
MLVAHEGQSRKKKGAGIGPAASLSSKYICFILRQAQDEVEFDCGAAEGLILSLSKEKAFQRGSPTPPA